MNPAVLAARPRGARLRWQVLALLLAVAACYANTLAVPFLLDDPRPGTALAFGSRPLVAASFALNRAWSGEATWSYHLLNLALHAAGGLALLGVLRRALALRLGRAEGAPLALAVTLLWLVHPLHTGAVTYLSQRAESLAVLCLLLTLYGFLRALDARTPRRWQALALLALALGFLCKEIVATAPALLLLAEFALVPGEPRANLRARWRFHGLVLLLCAGLAALWIVPPLFAPNSSSGFGAHESFGPLDYLRSQPGVILHYLRLSLWPHPLVFDYGWPVARTPAAWVPQSLLVGALLLGTLGLLWRRRWSGYALAVFFVVLAPTSSIVPVKDLAFEHRMLLPLAPLVLLAAVGVRRACRRWCPARPALPGALALLAFLALAAATVARNHDYRSAIALWQTVVERAPHNARGHTNLAAALIDEGRTQEAEAELARALELDPRSSFAHRNLAAIAARRGELAQAIVHLEAALAEVDSADARADLARLLAAGGRAAEAERELARALELAPRRLATRLELARLRLQLGRAHEALLVLEEDPAALRGSGEALLLLAETRSALGDPAGARAALEQALGLPALDALLTARLQARLRALAR